MPRGHPTSLPRASRLSKAGQNSLWRTCFSFRGSVSPGSREPWAEGGGGGGASARPVGGGHLPGYRRGRGPWPDPWSRRPTDIVQSPRATSGAPRQGCEAEAQPWGARASLGFPRPGSSGRACLCHLHPQTPPLTSAPQLGARPLPKPPAPCPHPTHLGDPVCHPVCDTSIPLQSP